MRSILILRHARAATGAGMADHDRPLDPVGTEEASRVGAYVAKRHGAPDLVRCSTARRARETVEVMRRAWSDQVMVTHEDGLYLASPEALLAIVAAAPDDVERLMVVGHNPGAEQFAAGLAGTGAAADRLVGLPTAGLAVLSVDGPWDALAWGTADLIDVAVPGD